MSMSEPQEIESIERESRCRRRACPRRTRAPSDRHCRRAQQPSAASIPLKAMAIDIARRLRPGRALHAAPAPSDESSGLQRAMNAFRMALPIVQRLLPLLDGNIGTAVANLLLPRPAPRNRAASAQSRSGSS